jgi:hypothetical protein
LIDALRFTIKAHTFVLHFAEELMGYLQDCESNEQAMPLYANVEKFSTGNGRDRNGKTMHLAVLFSKENEKRQPRLPNQNAFQTSIKIDTPIEARFIQGESYAD